MAERSFKIPIYKKAMMNWENQEKLEKHRRKVRGTQTNLFGKKLEYMR